MHKSTTKISAGGSLELRQALNSFATALRFVPDHFEGNEGADQPILDSSRETYKRVSLVDGTQYWIVAILSDMGAPWASLMASDPQTGTWFAVAVRHETIVRIEEFPKEIIERMPQEQRPFGFAAFSNKPLEKTGVSSNGH